MADLDINITLNGGEGASAVAETTGNNTETAKSNAKSAFTIDQATRVATRFARQIATNTVGSIGTFTGNNVLQERVERGISFASRGISVGVAFIANPVLGAAALVGEGIDVAFKLAQQQRKLEWQNVAASELRRRAGYESNRNRGGVR